ncbi:aminopeptidase P family protein, partial [Rhodococcus hoagii]|nr:aminopeptidase P family protein [Prescottella equi]
MSSHSAASAGLDASRFPTAVYADRLARAAQVAQRAGLDGLLVTPGPDLRYLIGSRADSFERLTCLVVPSDGNAPSVVLPRLELASLGDSAVGRTESAGTRLGGTASTILLRVGVVVLPETPRVAVTDAMTALHLVPLSRRFGGVP